MTTPRYCVVGALHSALNALSVVNLNFPGGNRRETVDWLLPVAEDIMLTTVLQAVDTTESHAVDPVASAPVMSTT